MAIVSIAVNYTITNEGGGKYTENPADTGGPTRWGVTLKTLANYRGKLCTAEDVKALTLPEATLIYKKLYWKVIRGDDIADQATAMALFDTSVLMGPGRAAKAMQTALNYTASPKTTPLKVDGRIGPASILAINSATPKVLMGAYVNEVMDELTDIVDGNATQILFLRGWLTRIAYYRCLPYTCAPTGTTLTAK